MPGQQPVNDPFADLGMMLHRAVRDRNISGFNGIKMLMQFGPPVDFLDEEGNTPLHRAVHMGFLPGVESLVMYNADIMAVDGQFGLSSEDLASTVIAMKQASNAYKTVPMGDLMACYRVLDAASCAAYSQNDSSWDIQLRPNDCVEVCDMQNGDLHLAMNGMVGVLQHYIEGPDAEHAPHAEHAADGRWRVGFSLGPARGPAFLHARNLRRV